MDLKSEPVGDFQSNIDLNEMSFVNSWKGWMQHKINSTINDVTYKVVSAVTPETPGA